MTTWQLSWKLLNSVSYVFGPKWREQKNSSMLCVSDAIPQWGWGWPCKSVSPPPTHTPSLGLRSVIHSESYYVVWQGSCTVWWTVLNLQVILRLESLCQALACCLLWGLERLFCWTPLSEQVLAWESCHPGIPLIRCQATEDAEVGARK